ncbi:MAG: dihydroorotase [Ignavibacteriae bacterium]|nr:MAG: dihydroorotase [Ignavibacteriota bacterium]
MKLVLKNVRVINPIQNIDEKKDILIENGIISKVGELTQEDLDNCKILELEGKICSPGLFDMHVHLREPGREYTETIKTGSNSAAAGGFTAVACMPNTTPTIDSAEVVNFIKNKAADHLVDVHPIGAVSKERKGEYLAPMAELVEAGAVGFSDDGVAVKTAALVRKALEYLKMYDLPLIEHCEDESLAGGAMNEGTVSTTLGLPSIPTIAEDLTVMRDISVAEYVDGKVHIAHISSKKAVELVREAKAKGIKITAEVTPHHFCLTDNELTSYNTNYKMNPPLRTEEDVRAMIEGLKDGTIDCIASDHAPHASEEKEAEFIYAPNGILGLETQLGLALTELYHKNHLTLSQIVEKLAINPRKILNIPVPLIKEGEKANLTIFDPDEIWTVDVKKFHSKSKNTPFDKRLITGKPIAVINNKKMYKDEKFTDLV